MNCIDTMEETQEIIIELVGNDVSTIIMPLLYPRCFKCKKLEYEEFSLDTYDDKWICGKCYMEDDYHTCNKCKKIFPANLFNWCSLCFDNCSLYCPKHLKDKFKVPYIDDVNLIMDILDDIIDVIADDTIFDNRYY